MKNQTLPKQINDFFSSQSFDPKLQAYKQKKYPGHLLHKKNSIPQLYYILDFQTGKFSFISEGLKSMFGYADEIWERGVDALWQMVHPDDIDDFSRVLVRWIEFLNSFQNESLLNRYAVWSNFRFVDKNGQSLPVILKNIYTSLDRQGNVVYNLCKVLPVSDQERENGVSMQIHYQGDGNILQSKPRTPLPQDPYLKINGFHKISRHNHFIARVEEIIRHHLDDEHFGVRELSDALNLSRTQVYRKIYSQIEKAPNELIRLVRLVEAAKLLEHNDLNVTEVTYKVGFSNPAYFIKCFKQVYGITPKQYQRAYD